jgi:hypothetical protein
VVEHYPQHPKVVVSCPASAAESGYENNGKEACTKIRLGKLSMQSKQIEIDSYKSESHDTMIKQVAVNKSSLLLKIQESNTQTLQLD